MKAIKKGRGKDRGFWVWEAEDPPAIYRTPVRTGKDDDPAKSILNRRRVREMKDGT